MLSDREREAIAKLWEEKQAQDAGGVPQAERHRNLEPSSAEFIHVMAAGCGAQRMLEIGGSTGLSTIALASAARQTGGRLASIEREPLRQAQARRNLERLGLADRVDFIQADAGEVLRRYRNLDFVLIDCEKEDYIRFLALLHLSAGAIVVADNILSHDLHDYVEAVREYPAVESVTLPIGKGLEVSRFVAGWPGPAFMS